MRLPNEVNILGTYFRVTQFMPTDPNEYGTSNQPERLIRIRADLSDEAKIEVFYHELVHMILAHIGLDRVLKDDMDEAVAQGVGAALAFVISANELPKLVKEEA